MNSRLIIHFAVKGLNGDQWSLCGVEYEDVIQNGEIKDRLYGAAKRSTRAKDVTCTLCSSELTQTVAFQDQPISR